MVRNIVLIFALLLSFSAIAKNPPPNPGKTDKAFVTDHKDADALTPEQERALTRKLRAYFDSTSNQIVVLIEQSLEGDDVFNYSLKVAKEWGLGEANKDNGILIYVATRDRKAFIQVGRGLEGAVPDALAGRVVDQILIPNFKNVGYYKGLDEGIDRLIQYASGEYKNDRKKSKNGFPAWVVVVLIIVFMIIFSSFGDNSGKTYSGSRRGWMMGPAAGGFIGGGGGFSGGGGGGFGGFGGGGFGGGGAGGSW